MILSGDKTILRPIRMSDAHRFFMWMSDPNVNKYTTRKSITLKEEENWIKNLSKRKTDKIFAVDTIEKVHIGSVGLHHIENQDKNAVLGIFIGDKNYWNKGYGMDTIIILLNYCFNKLKFHRVELSVYGYNKRAINLYKKLGFKTEGSKREHVFYKGKFYDEIQMGILRNEWRKKQFSTDFSKKK